MAQPIVKPIHPPQAGVVRKFGFQFQPPYSCIESVNFWPFNPADNRRVSCTRAPLGAFANPANTNINLLTPVNGDTGQYPQQSFLVAANGVLYLWMGGSTYQVVDEGESNVPTISTGRPVYCATMIFDTVIANNGDPLVYNNASQENLPSSEPRLTELTASEGTVPYDCRVVASWQGAMWFGGAHSTPHILYGSRTGDITDFDYAVDDEGGAFATTGDNEGLLGGPIVALIPQTADAMIIGCENGMFILRGHPRRGGIMEVLSASVGPLGQGAWCKLPDDTLFMLTKTGIVILESNATATPTELSRQRIPDDLISLVYDSQNPVVSMAYDTQWKFVHINVRGDEEQAWIYDVENGGFYQQEYEQYPTVVLSMPSLAEENKSGVLHGTATGMYRFDLTDTDQETISCHQMIGPIKISDNPFKKSKITECRTILGIESGLNGTIGWWCGMDGEEVYNNISNDSQRRTFETDLQSLQRNNGMTRPEVAGHALILQIEGEVTSAPVIFEEAEITLVDAGRERAARNLAVAPEVFAGADQTVEFT